MARRPPPSRQAQAASALAPREDRSGGPRETGPHPALGLEPQLATGADALGVSLSTVQVQQLLHYLELLLKWNRVYNLTAVRGAQEALHHHLLDSLAILPSLVRHLDGRPARILDVGSGGGLPGVVIAIARPDWHVDCVDAVAKKAAFVQQAAAELGLARLRGIHSRIEQLPRANADVVTSRAFASLPDFTRWTAAHLNDNGVWMAMKGKEPKDEIRALPPTVDVFHVEHLQVPGLDAERCLVWMRPTGKNTPPLA